MIKTKTINWINTFNEINSSLLLFLKNRQIRENIKYFYDNWLLQNYFINEIFNVFALALINFKN